MRQASSGNHPPCPENGKTSPTTPEIKPGMPTRRPDLAPITLSADHPSPNNLISETKRNRTKICLVICTGLRIKGGVQYWGIFATSLFHDRRQKG